MANAYKRHAKSTQFMPMAAASVKPKHVLGRLRTENGKWFFVSDTLIETVAIEGNIFWDAKRHGDFVVLENVTDVSISKADSIYLSFPERRKHEGFVYKDDSDNWFFQKFQWRPIAIVFSEEDTLWGEDKDCEEASAYLTIGQTNWVGASHVHF